MTDFYCVRCDSDREHCKCERPSIGAYKEIPPAWIVQELWGLGLTIIPRAKGEKVFDLAKDLAPVGMAYQWNEHLNAAAKVVGWKCIPASRHPGLFMPYGYTGDIEVNGLWLMERPKAEVDAFHAASHAKARQNVDDWFNIQGTAGFVGGVTLLSEGSDGNQSSDIREVGNKTTENLTKIPHDLMPYVSDIFAERDRLWAISDQWWDKPTLEYLHYTTLAAENPTWTRGQIMNAVLTPIAINNIRLATEATNEQSTNSSSDGTADQAQAGTPENGTS